ncbi:MAG: Xaa-Pro dipeptidase [Planctomycetota bacterium JB042]
MDTPVDLEQLTREYQDHVRWLTDRYDEALRATGHDGVIVHSGSPRPRSIFDDQFWPMRATPHFQHWLPLVTAHSALVIEPGKTPKLLWNRELGFWEDPAPPETDHFWSAFDVVELTEAAKLKDHLPSPGAGRYAMITEDFDDADAWGVPSELRNPDDLKARLDDLRTVKTAYETTCLREANRRACLGHARVMEEFRRGDLSELQLHLLYLEATEQDDPETPYKNIVALGEHAATLHHVSYSRRREGAQSLLLDAGARYQGYESDITRTGVKGAGAATDVFSGLIDRMESLQKETCARVRTGLNYQSLHDQSHELLAPVLRDLGIANGSDAELVDTGITRTFLPHGLGHSLGLQTHDVGCRNVDPDPRNPFLRNTRDIEPKQCFTIEPGCYFIKSLLDDLRAKPEGTLIDWTLVDELTKFGGVRIEDDLVVEEGGVENLTREYL